MRRLIMIHLEGATLIQLSDKIENNVIGPSTKDYEKVFYNPAMSGSRTRSIMLMKHIIGSGYLGDSEIYAIDGLAASGLRARRWLNELPPEQANRLKVTICDMNENSIERAMENYREYPPRNGKDNLSYRQGDLRSAILDQGWHWVDIDPFGSPMPFLDTAIQSLAKKAILEISATDTAALAGSSKTALMRRYGARIKPDNLAHDSGLRVLMACIARAAARHDRFAEPILSVWDSHHLRISLKVKKSVERANELEKCLGWRVSEPNEREVVDSMEEGLTPRSSTKSLPMHCFLPLSYPVNREDKRISGPLWIAPLGDAKVMSSFIEDDVVSMCTTEFSPKNPMNWDKRDFELERRRVIRSIKNIKNEAEIIEGEFLILTDDLASWRNVGSPPSPNKMVEIINEKGFKAGLSHYPKPSFRTNAPWDVIIECLEQTQPPI